MTAFWYIAQALGVLLNAAIVQIPIALVYQFFLYFTLMVLVIAVFIFINWTFTLISTGSGTEINTAKSVT